VTRRLVQALVAAAALALGGATLFGLWHIVVGGLVAGNPRAAEFGIMLALVAGALLAVLLLVARRSFPARGR
jgi:hypothetical protein